MVRTARIGAPSRVGPDRRSSHGRSTENEHDEGDMPGERTSWWTRTFRRIAPDRLGRRWDRLPEGSREDAAHYNMRSGL